MKMSLNNTVASLLIMGLAGSTLGFAKETSNPKSSQSLKTQVSKLLESSNRKKPSALKQIKNAVTNTMECHGTAAVAVDNTNVGVCLVWGSSSGTANSDTLYSVTVSQDDFESSAVTYSVTSLTGEI